MTQNTDGEQRTPTRRRDIPEGAERVFEKKETTKPAIDVETGYRGDDRVGQLQEQVQLLQEGLKQGLEQQLRMAAKLRQHAEQLEKYGPSVRIRVILAVLAGLTGWAPSLVLELHAVWTLWGCCRGMWNPESNHHDRYRLPSTTGGTARMSSKIKIIVYLVISIVDFLDGILDIVVSLQTVLRDDEDENQYAQRWALVLFCMTIAGRILGGVFGVFYERIDESDREVTYFLVEMTIWCMEDVAAINYLMVKSEYTQLDYANSILTFICAGLFLASIALNALSIIKRIEPCFAGILIPSMAGLFSYVLSYFLGFDVDIDKTEHQLAQTNYELFIMYLLVLLLMLSVLFVWCRAIAQKRRWWDDENLVLALEEFDV